MAKLTKKQAEEALSLYVKQQTDAANAAIEAYDRARDSEVAAAEAQTAEGEREAMLTAREALDTAAVKALVDRYAVREAVAGLGLGGSGIAVSADKAVAQRERRAVLDAETRRKATVSALTAKLLTAREKAAGQKAENAASVRKSLSNKIAERRLTLAKNTV